MKELRIISGGLIAAFALAELFVIPEPILPTWGSLALLLTASVVTGD